jgi:hypothetical protein
VLNPYPPRLTGFRADRIKVTGVTALVQYETYKGVTCLPEEHSHGGTQHPLRQELRSNASV